MVGGYMLSQPGNGAFSIPVTSFPVENCIRVVYPEIWTAYLDSDAKQKQIKVRAPSYVIDRIIEHFTEEYRNNNLVIGQDRPLTYHEQAFRLIAAESRLSRQLISAAFHEIWNESTNTFWSNIVSSQDRPNLFYLWLLYPEPPEELSDEQSEKLLLHHLTQYMLVGRSKFPEAGLIVGICLPNRECSKTSNLIRIMDGEHWTPNHQQLADELENKYGILSNIETTVHATSRC